MSKLSDYIEDLKRRISEKGNMNEIEIIRYVYIDLGRKMDFDLNYTFGNSETKKNIYKEHISEETLSKALETHTAICKSLSYLLERILKEFNIDIVTVHKEDMYTGRLGKHVYNIVKLKNNERYILDLEDDLEYIQSGAKTRRFGTNINQEKEPMASEEELRNIDIDKVDYIPEGYYLEDMIWMLKLAVTSKDLRLYEKLDMVLKNLNVYKDNSKVKYRERIRYHERIFEEIFTPSELNKIHLINCYKDIGGERIYNSCIVLDMPKNEKKAYIFSLENYNYEEISMLELSKMIRNGLTPMKGIPGIKKYLNKREKGDLEL